VVVHEAAAPCSVSAEVSAILAEKAFSALKSPVVRLTGPDAPAASSFPLEAAFAPNAERIVEAVRRVVVQ
jgi:pyruvate dehydrogenase E1 component beta subunit